MKWEAVLLVTIIALLRPLCQVVVKKLQAESEHARNKGFSYSGHGGTGVSPVLPARSDRLSINPKLLYFDGRTGVRELLLDGLGFFLRDAIFHGLRCAINQVFRFF